MAHITGGAFYDKLTKILPKGKCFVIDRVSWPVPEIFRIIQKKGKIESREMFRTFNMGIGMACIFRAKDVPAVRSYLKKKKIKFYNIGTVIEDSKRKIVI
jgi:phosphoribosylformylglycinamidine cyclo-ligase